MLEGKKKRRGEERRGVEFLADSATTSQQRSSICKAGFRVSVQVPACSGQLTVNIPTPGPSGPRQ